MFGEATFREASRSALTIPETAVGRSGELRTVYVVAGKHLQRRFVTLGVTRHGRTEVLSGLSPGELVAIASQSRLSDGAAVEVRP